MVTERNLAPYEFKQNAKDSPYVKLQGPDGEKTIWGVDLPRALDDASVKLGDSIALEFRGMRAVTVPVKDLDKAGQVVGWHDETVNRNTWVAAKVDDLRAEALKPALQPRAPVVRDGVPQPVEPVLSARLPTAWQASRPPRRRCRTWARCQRSPVLMRPLATAVWTRRRSLVAKLAQTQTRAHVEAPQAAVKPAVFGKDAEPPALAAFDAALKQKNVTAALHQPLREIFGRELAVR